MDTIKKMLPYLVVILLAFYILPLFIKDTGSGMYMLLIVIPLICSIVSIIYGKKEKFSVAYSIIVALLFIPTIFIYFNDSAAVYIAIYGLICIAFNFIGVNLNNII